MSLSELIRIKHEEALTEACKLLKDEDTAEGLTCSIWLDATRKPKHGPRFKVSHTSGFDSNENIPVKIPSMEPVGIPKKVLSAKERKDLEKLREFMGREALSEAINNLWKYGTDCGLTPDDFLNAVVELLSTWHVGDKDDYESDLVVIKRYAPNYKPVPIPKSKERK